MKSFVAIVRTGNLTRAANQLNISQSALSSQIKQLEDELEFQLFERSSRGMRLNNAGREMLPFVETLLEAEENLLQKAHALRHGGGEALNVGLNADPGFLRVGATNRRLQKLYRGMNVIFLASQTARTAQLLRQGQLDLAFLYGSTSDPDIHCQQLVDVRFCVVIPVALLAENTDLNWPQVAALPWVWVEHGSPPYDALLQKFTRSRLLPKQAVKTVDEYIVKELVLDGQGLAIMREDEARPLADAGQVVIWQKGWLSLPLSLAWMARNDDKFQVRRAREVISYLWQSAGSAAGPGGAYDY